MPFVTDVGRGVTDGVTDEKSTKPAWILGCNRVTDVTADMSVLREKRRNNNEY